MLEEDPESIWMTGPPPQIPFAAAGLRWRMAVTFSLPIVTGAILLVHAALWAGGLTAIQNLAILLIAIAAVTAILLAMWISWRPRGSRRRRT